MVTSNLVHIIYFVVSYAVRIMYDKDTGRSRGFGFVNFSTQDEATSAKDAMDGKVSKKNLLRMPQHLKSKHYFFYPMVV